VFQISYNHNRRCCVIEIAYLQIGWILELEVQASNPISVAEGRDKSTGGNAIVTPNFSIPGHNRFTAPEI
jgi:hypothetical protein